MNKFNQKVNHITQSYQWGEFRQKTGIKVIRFGDLTLYLHPLPHLPYFIGYLPRPADLNKRIIKELIRIGKENRCIFIKIEPNLSRHIIISSYHHIIPSKPILPRHTFFIDLTKSESELLKNMHEKTRYNIRLAQKHGVIVKEGKTENDLESFIKILENTEKRQGFFSHPSNYYRLLWKTLRSAEMVYLLLAYPPNSTIQQFNNSTIVPIASLILFKFKDILYYPYGGSLENFRNLMPNHLLHWEAIRLGKKLGCKIYDLWGAYKNKPDESDPWWGIYRFKSGFGGNLISYPETFDLIINPLLYKIYSVVDLLRWKIIRLKRSSLK